MTSSCRKDSNRKLHVEVKDASVEFEQALQA